MQYVELLTRWYKMTLETCKKRLEIAEKVGDKKEIEFWKKRILKKGGKVETKDGKKSKR